MQVIPAVDLMSGRVVRLIKGDATQRSEYGDPSEAVRRWVEEGAELIHIVDLDAALGKGSNIELVKSIIKDSHATIQVGGGIRSLEAASSLLDGGAERVMLGSIAFKEPTVVRSLLTEYGPSRVVVSLDHSRGWIRISGWLAKAGVELNEALKDFRRLGAELFLVTCIDRDGTLSSPDTESVRSLSSKARVISAGGVSSLHDIESLREAGAEAAVVGKALYEARFTLREARKAAQ